MPIQQGRIYDSPESVKNIPSFIETYSIALDELLEPDPTKYPTMNAFFYRRLKPGVRPVQNADVAGAICSAADCRLVVYPSVDLAKKFWIKGTEFTIPHLLGVPPDSDAARAFAGALEKLDRALALATQQVDLSSRLDTRIAMLKDEITLKKEMLGIVA